MAIQAGYSRYPGHYYDYDQQNTRVSQTSWYDQPKSLSNNIATFILDCVIYFILTIPVLILIAIIFLK